MFCWHPWQNIRFGKLPSLLLLLHRWCPCFLHLIHINLLLAGRRCLAALVTKQELRILFLNIRVSADRGVSDSRPLCEVCIQLKAALRSLYTSRYSPNKPSIRRQPTWIPHKHPTNMTRYISVLFRTSAIQCASVAPGRAIQTRRRRHNPTSHRRAHLVAADTESRATDRQHVWVGAESWLRAERACRTGRDDRRQPPGREPGLSPPHPGDRYLPVDGRIITRPRRARRKHRRIMWCCQGSVRTKMCGHYWHCISFLSKPYWRRSGGKNSWWWRLYYSLSFLFLWHFKGNLPFQIIWSPAKSSSKSNKAPYWPNQISKFQPVPKIK